MQIEQKRYFADPAKILGKLKKRLSANQTKINCFTRAIGENGHTTALLDALNTAEIERDQIEYELVQVEKIGPDPELPPEELKKIVTSIEKKLKGGDQEGKIKA